MSAQFWRMPYGRGLGRSITRTSFGALFNEKVRAGKARVMHPDSDLCTPARIEQEQPVEYRS